MPAKLLSSAISFLDPALAFGSEIESFELNEMEMALFPAFCYHSLEAIEYSKCLIFTSNSREGNSYEEDTFRINDIESFKLT